MGMFELKQVPDGTYQLRVSLLGFRTRIDTKIIVKKKYKDNLEYVLEQGRSEEIVGISAPRLTNSLSGRVTDSMGQALPGITVERITGYVWKDER
jgi:IS4 transposase